MYLQQWKANMLREVFKEKRKENGVLQRTCKPHDFVITNNSGAYPPSNNIYRQKLSDVSLISEDSNDCRKYIDRWR